VYCEVQPGVVFCVPTATPKPTATPTLTKGCPFKVCGDANCDGKVDKNDLVIWMNDKGTNKSEADFNKDGVVDVKDYMLLENGIVNGCKGMPIPSPVATEYPRMSCNMTVNPPRNCPAGYQCVTTGSMPGADGTCMASNSLPTPGSCSALWWFDGTSRVCSIKQFCGAYAYAGLRTFTSQAECLKALAAVLPTPTPVMSAACMKLETTKAQYFKICKDGGFGGVCFNKSSSVYQGCTQIGINTCTASNTNASKNLWCEFLAGKPVPSPTVAIAPTDYPKMSCNLTVNPPRNCPSGYRCEVRSDMAGADGTCVSTSTPPSGPTGVSCKANYGDANGDGQVTLTDYSIWKYEYMSGKGTTSDFNCDGRVDLNDYAIWKAAFLKAKNNISVSTNN
jgi:hypothetical protein